MTKPSNSAGGDLVNYEAIPIASAGPVEAIIDDPSVPTVRAAASSTLSTAALSSNGYAPLTTDSTGSTDSTDSNGSHGNTLNSSSNDSSNSGESKSRVSLNVSTIDIRSGAVVIPTTKTTSPADEIPPSRTQQCINFFGAMTDVWAVIAMITALSNAFYALAGPSDTKIKNIGIDWWNTIENQHFLGFLPMREVSLFSAFFSFIINAALNHEHIPKALNNLKDGIINFPAHTQKRKLITIESLILATTAAFAAAELAISGLNWMLVDKALEEKLVTPTLIFISSMTAWVAHLLMYHANKYRYNEDKAKQNRLQKISWLCSSFLGTGLFFILKYLAVPQATVIVWTQTLVYSIGALTGFAYFGLRYSGNKSFTERTINHFVSKDHHDLNNIKAGLYRLNASLTPAQKKLIKYTEGHDYAAVCADIIADVYDTQAIPSANPSKEKIKTCITYTLNSIAFGLSIFAFFIFFQKFIAFVKDIETQRLNNEGFGLHTEDPFYHAQNIHNITTFNNIYNFGTNSAKFIFSIIGAVCAGIPSLGLYFTSGLDLQHHVKKMGYASQHELSRTQSAWMWTKFFSGLLIANSLAAFSMYSVAKSVMAEPDFLFTSNNTDWVKFFIWTIYVAGFITNGKSFVTELLAPLKSSKNKPAKMWDVLCYADEEPDKLIHALKEKVRSGSEAGKILLKHGFFNHAIASENRNGSIPHVPSAVELESPHNRLITAV